MITKKQRYWVILLSEDIKKIKKTAKKVSLGKTTYFSSQAITILNNELDRREL